MCVLYLYHTEPVHRWWLYWPHYARLLSSSRTCCLITALIVFNISKCSSGAPPKGLAACWSVRTLSFVITFITCSSQRTSIELCSGSVELYTTWRKSSVCLYQVFNPRTRKLPCYSLTAPSTCCLSELLFPRSRMNFEPQDLFGGQNSHAIPQNITIKLWLILIIRNRINKKTFLFGHVRCVSSKI